MSEHINNREYRQKMLKEMILELHDGKSVEDVKEKFAETIKGVTAGEISQMETSLIKEGMPVEEIQRLCDVHASLFKGSIEEIHSVKSAEDQPGHPVHTFRLENEAIQKLIDDGIKPHIEKLENDDNDFNIHELEKDFGKLWEIDKHYARKENLVFPFMEAKDITAPPKVMWAVDDQIRVMIKETRKLLDGYGYLVSKIELLAKVKETVHNIEEMIFKEENILFPMVLEALNDREWEKIVQDSPEFGFSLVEPGDEWIPDLTDIPEAAAGSYCMEHVKFDAGILLPEEINAMLNALPLDITFVDKDGAVKYFTQGKERIFARPKSIIGRQVSNCHPPASMHIVEKIMEDLKSGKKDHEDFWIRMGDKFIQIRYFAVRNAEGEYLGVIEVSQDIKPIQELKGEKRLMTE
ncbi:MAG: DUF438 domain-containing protein [Eubacteriaceae bacterium]|nr:DUF438 domain-containing protein [Eubacteriaceae bacterium]